MRHGFGPTFFYQKIHKTANTIRVIIMKELPKQARESIRCFERGMASSSSLSFASTFASVSSFVSVPSSN